MFLLRLLLSVLSFIYLPVAVCTGSRSKVIKRTFLTRMSSSQSITWCVVGAGDVCEIKAAPAAFRNAGKDCEVSCIVRRNEEKGMDFCSRHGIDTAYTTFQDMIAGEAGKVNAVYISTPPASHAEYTKLCLEAGIKNVYVEKPVCLSAEEARALKVEVEKHDAKLVVAHYRNSLPMFKYISELLHEKEVIGKVRTVNIRVARADAGHTAAGGNWRLDPSMSGGGYFHDISPHALALMQMMFGDAEESSISGVSLQQGEVSGEGPVDLVTGVYKLPNANDRGGTGAAGASITMSWCFTVGQGDEADECLVTGEKGTIRFPFYTGSDVHVTIAGERSNEYSQHFTHPVNIQASMIDDVTRYFRGEEGCGNPCSIDQAIKVMTIIDKLTI